ncbi:MAG: tRNA (adenosine(37)-N6)-dimethylallyltransferase MiaA [Pseudomonadota bacterium]
MQRLRHIVIAGPTASGKSAFAMRVAKVARERGLEPRIINGDSMQVYADLSIITARPSEADQADVPHHLFGHVDGAETYSVARWLREVADHMRPSNGEGDPLTIFVGGTGMYLRALFEGIADIPDIRPDVRQLVEGIVEQDQGVQGALWRALADIDPTMANRLETGDRQRLARALMVRLSTGRSLADWQSDQKSSLLHANDASTKQLIIDWPRDQLYDRINVRLDGMIDAGALAEVERLHARNLPPKKPVMKALGVPSLLAHLRGELSREDALDDAKMRMRRFAKRQLTWLRHQFPDWQRIHADGDQSECWITETIFQ